MDQRIIGIVDKLVKYSKTKLINPVAFLAALNLLLKNKKNFTRQELENEYKKTVREIKANTGSDLNIGGRFHADTYPDRMARKYNAFLMLSEDKMQLPPFIVKLPQKAQREIKEFVFKRIIVAQRNKIGNIQSIDTHKKRILLADNKDKFIEFLARELQRSASSFEVVCFAVLKVFLEKFACKLYRNSKTNARDTGIDISTDYGVVYQIKKFKIRRKKEVEKILKEFKVNFDQSRIEDGKLILIIEDVDANFKHFIIFEF